MHCAKTQTKIAEVRAYPRHPLGMNHSEAGSRSHRKFFKIMTFYFYIFVAGRSNSSPLSQSGLESKSHQGNLRYPQCQR